jgi:DNA-binding winged helix-turn-helix (wHTH) protein
MPQASNSKRALLRPSLVRKTQGNRLHWIFLTSSLNRRAQSEMRRAQADLTVSYLLDMMVSMAPRSILAAALARAGLAATGSRERYPTEPVTAIRASVLEARQGSVTHGPTPNQESDSPADDPLANLAKLLGGPRWEEVVAKLIEFADNTGALPASDRPAPSGTVEVGDLVVETDAHRVLVAGREVALTSLEFRLLATLVDRRDRVQSRGVLLNDVWELPSSSRTRTVDTHVRRLRDKLGATGQFIQTVRGVGYRFSERHSSIRHPDGRCKPLTRDQFARS